MISRTTFRSTIQAADEPARARSSTDTRSTLIRPILHLEGAALFVAAIAVYGRMGGDWLLFVPLLLVPDLSLLGYVVGPRVGALGYNLAHNLATALLVLGIGLALGIAWITVAGVLLVGHVGMDRAVGYGLKYAANPKVTHLQRV